MVSVVSRSKWYASSMSGTWSVGSENAGTSMSVSMPNVWLTETWMSGTLPLPTPAACCLVLLHCALSLRTKKAAIGGRSRANPIDHASSMSTPS